jgi:uncharacterized protein (TIGR00369 family)
MDPVAPGRAGIPAGFEPVRQPDGFIDHLAGIHWTRRRKTAVETCLIVAKYHTNPIGTAHGGVILTLLDLTLGATAQAYIGHDGPGHPATVQLSTNFIAGAREGDLLMGEAVVDSATRTMSFVSGRLHVDGKTIATASAVFRNPPSNKS